VCLPSLPVHSTVVPTESEGYEFVEQCFHKLYSAAM
jgi:hypothetical protein